jgi:hypothetical protein
LPTTVLRFDFNADAGDAVEPVDLAGAGERVKYQTGLVVVSGSQEVRETLEDGVRKFGGMGDGHDFCRGSMK